MFTSKRLCHKAAHSVEAFVFVAEFEIRQPTTNAN